MKKAYKMQWKNFKSGTTDIGPVMCRRVWDADKGCNVKIPMALIEARRTVDRFNRSYTRAKHSLVEVAI